MLLCRGEGGDRRQTDAEPGGWRRSGSVQPGQDYRGGLSGVVYEYMRGGGEGGAPRDTDSERGNTDG